MKGAEFSKEKKACLAWKIKRTVNLLNGLCSYDSYSSIDVFLTVKCEDVLFGAKDNPCCNFLLNGFSASVTFPTDPFTTFQNHIKFANLLTFEIVKGPVGRFLL